MNAAYEYGKHLPSFSDLGEAKVALYQRRDVLIEAIVSSAEATNLFDASFSPESLKGLEAWYFNLIESDSFQRIGVNRIAFEQAMAMYFGETLVRNSADFEWIVQEFPFEAGKYEIGVKKRLFTMMLGGFGSVADRPNNKRRESIWRDYQQCVA
jgi:hypothetical protein